MGKKSISMNIDDTLEFDYQVEEISDNVVAVNKNAGAISESYYSTDTYVFDPQSTGSYELDINGQIIEIEVTDIPDSGMFQSPIYQYTAVAGLNASDGGTADNWTEQLAGAGDATTTFAPVYRADQSGFESVEYDGTDDGHDFPSDGQLPTGTGPVSFAATIYMKDTSGINTIAFYGNASTNDAVLFSIDDGAVRLGLFGTSTGRVNAGSVSSGQWVTVGGTITLNDTEAYVNGASVGTDTNASPNLKDANRAIGYRPTDNNLYSDMYLHDIIISDARESDQAFSDYDTNRLG
jgi:hypothetical protein